MYHLRSRVRRIHQDAALTSTTVVHLALTEKDIAVHSPISAPRVLYLPKLVAARRVRAVADRQYTVIQLGAARSRHNTTAVELEGVLVRLNGNRHGLLCNRRLECWLRVDRYIRVRLNLRRHLLRLGSGASAILRRVGIVRLSGETLVCNNVLKGGVHETTVAALVTLGRRAVNELLLREGDERTIGEKPRSLNRAGGRERPAGAALSLVLDRRHGTLRRPVNGRRSDKGRRSKVAVWERAAVSLVHVVAARDVSLGKLVGSEVGKLVHRHRPGVTSSIVVLNLDEVGVPDILTVLRLAHGRVCTIEGIRPLGERGRSSDSE